jgi:predicted HTH transcriptional regulator
LSKKYAACPPKVHPHPLATDLRLRAAQCRINPRHSKVLERLLEAGYVGSGGGFLGGLTSEKCAKITGASKATATRDLADLLAHGLLRVEGVGKATRYAVTVPGW